ncbi:hypothetical protein FSP39_011130 [Pinctada imbricata]|uniref:Uncharacterized protein n=1 Tax=Pinctada imbricata TaxID=66713 RepID=A0AA89BND3_PINIB|nr:hypothetical protein FSP39_011130 [Pinctada imbricata]
MRELPVTSVSHYNVSQLISRLVPFLSSQHQIELLHRFPVKTSFWFWSSVRVWSLSPQIQKGVVTELAVQGIDRLRQFSHKMEKTGQDFNNLNDALKCLINITNSRTAVDKFLSTPSLSSMLDVLCQLWASILVSDWLSAHLTQVSLGYLLQLSANLVDKQTNGNLLKILSVINAILKQRSVSFLRLSIAIFLQECGKVKIGPSFEQSQILNKLPDCFVPVISDREALVHQTAVHAFTQFAEETPHESVVTECIQRNQDVQQTVVNYLNKVNSICIVTNIRPRLHQFAEETPHELVVTKCIQRNQDVQQTVVNYLLK